MNSTVGPRFTAYARFSQVWLGRKQCYKTQSKMQNAK